ncbi:MAG: Fe-S cluster assembly protein SufD [Actinomycetota bacterium]|nr:Fe-S cluster assembly protein SufD [Actinomycetota bacterium]
MTTAPTETGVPTLDTLSEEAIAHRSEAAGEPTWLLDRRLEAYKRWADLGWPKLRGEEAWKDTPFTRFVVDLPLVTGDVDVPAPPAPEAVTVPAVLVDGLAQCGARADVRDGELDVWVSDAQTTAGVVVCDLAVAAERYEGLVREHLGRLTADHDGTVAANDAAWTRGVFVYVPPEAELDAPIGVTIRVGRAGTHLPRLLVVVERHASAQLFCEHVSAGLGDDRATVDEVVEVIVADGAKLDFVTAQDWEGRVGHMVVQGFELHRDTQVRHLAVTIGGDTVRMRPEVHLVGPGSRIEPLGVYFSHGGQHFEHHPFIEHVAGHAVSDVLYKGALQGHSRTVFRGHIYVHRDAVGSDSNETNKSLVLTAGAKADSTPFLEIECADVKAGHGSATGQVDENQLFYLHSRGIPPDEALRLVVFGFFAEVLDRIDIPSVLERTMNHIAEEINAVDLATVVGRGRPSLSEKGEYD